MEKHEIDSGKYADLRRRAEAVVHQEPREVSEILPEDIQRLVYELRVYQIELEMQNEELRRTQRELAQARDRYFDLFDLAPVGYFALSEKGLILQANLAAASMLDVARSQLLNMRFTQFIVPDDQDLYYLHRKRVVESRALQSCELRMVRDGARPFHAHLESTAQTSDGQDQFRVTIIDVSERVRAEQELQQLYAQSRRDAETKDLLLHEIHHRVKNNLQIISSLLNLQADQVKEPQIFRALQDSQHRVRAMALVHESLYQTSDLARLNLGGYLQELLGYLTSAYEGPMSAVDLVVQVEDVSLGLDQAIPCGLILTELVSNALKHAFHHGQAGAIQIALRAHNGQVELTVHDDGVGLPAEVDPQTAPTLGLNIVQMLTRQLKGTLTVDSAADKGAAFTVAFPLPVEQGA